MIISLIILGVLNTFISRLNGMGCSAYKFIDHVKLGLAPSYTNRQNEWEGLDGLINKLKNTQTQFRNIKSESDELNKNINAASDTYQQDCNTQYTTLKENSNRINTLITDSFEELTADQTINDLSEVRKDIQKAEDDAGDTIYDSMHDHTNKWAKKILIAIFTLTLIFSLLAILILCLYFCCKSNFFRIIYVIIWNISMLLMILSILAGVLFGVIGYIFHDFVQVGQFILSTENLDSANPIVFDSGDKYVSDLIDTCTNGDGNFTKIVEGGNELNENLEEWKNHKTQYQTLRDNINCQSTDNTNNLKDYYNSLISMVDRSLDLTYNITNVSCGFAKNDKNILLNEADTGGIKGIGLCACSFLVGIFLGISIVAGILLVHKYQVSNKGASNINLNKFEVNESKENIGRRNYIPNPNMMYYPNK